MPRLPAILAVDNQTGQPPARELRHPCRVRCETTSASTVIRGDGGSSFRSQVSRNIAATPKGSRTVGWCRLNHDECLECNLEKTAQGTRTCLAARNPNTPRNKNAKRSMSKWDYEARGVPDIQEVRCRAAEIRQRWSPAEKRRRIGLPPDAPVRLRQYVLGHSILEWQTAPGDPISTR